MAEPQKSVFSTNRAIHSLSLGDYQFNVVFFNICCLSSTCNYSTKWLSIHLLRSRQELVKLAMKFMIAGIQIVDKLQVKMTFQLICDKDGGIEMH